MYVKKSNSFSIILLKKEKRLRTYGCIIIYVMARENIQKGKKSTTNS